MDRLAELISKLKEQFEQRADNAKLLGITLLIERELMKMDAQKKPAQPSPAPASSSKVSVVMPAPRNGHIQKEEPPVQEEIADVELPFTPVASTPVPPPVVQQQQVDTPPVIQEKPVAAPQEIYKGLARDKPSPTPASRQEFLFDPMQEIPTLAQQKATPKEINELIGLRDPSLNDKLKENRVEIGHTLTEHPIRDLKKAIGINDRQIFINELFRGDEVMYERSLKTINSFKIYAEAEYWMERELKVKLGWEEHRDTTKHFLQLIKRRFA